MTLTARVRVLDVELDAFPAALEGLDGYAAVQALIRLHGIPLGTVRLPVQGGRCTGEALREAVLRDLRWPLTQHLLADALAAAPSAASGPEGLDMDAVVRAPHPVREGRQPTVTVAVCTRDRTADLAVCLESLSQLRYPHLELLVVDNAPTSEETERLVRERYPQVRYVREPRPGLDWARNRAAVEARGELIAYTDDDVVVDSQWVAALAAVFADHPEVMAVTGLVVPYELETAAQQLFEQYGGFGRGYDEQWFSLDRSGGATHGFHGAGRFGTGANMAFRRTVFDHVGPFDPALDVGTVTNGGGDLEMFFRVLKAGHTLVYLPAAVVRHRHRREYARLRTQIANNGIGFYSFLIRTGLAYPEERRALLRFGVWWFWYWSVRRLIASLLRPGGFPRDLIWAELRGAIVGVGRYPQARRVAAALATEVDAPRRATLSPPVVAVPPVSVAVRQIDVSRPLTPLADVAAYSSVRCVVTRGEALLGTVDVDNHGRPITLERLRHALAGGLGLALVSSPDERSTDTRWAQLTTALARRLSPSGRSATTPPVPLPDEVAVSVVVATLDRPDDLRRCLASLTAQETRRRVEIVVADNHPASGLTAPVVAEFPAVRLVVEPRRGLSYARNAGIVHSTGAIVVSTDDDVTAPPGWLERLVAPFSRPDVMVVTGNVLPRSLETQAERLFEVYGGLGRGFQEREVDGQWFDSFRRDAVPTWTLGAAANAAVRAAVFHDPAIGLLDEALGAGTPTGCSEDTYLFYRVLKAGHTLVYAPSAFVWHAHRADQQALRRQLYNYSKGHVAYHLTTLVRDGDLRALTRLLVGLPRTRLRQVRDRLAGRSAYPLSLALVETAGNLAGAWALVQSRRRVARDGRSAPYVPFARRPPAHRQPAGAGGTSRRAA